MLVTSVIVNCSCERMTETVVVMKDHLFGEYDTLT